jgi:hypothetical protein
VYGQTNKNYSSNSKQTTTEYREQCWRAYSTQDASVMALIKKYNRLLAQMNATEEKRQMETIAFNLRRDVYGRQPIPQRITDLEKQYLALKKDVEQTQAKVKLIKFEYTKKITPKS